MPSHSEPQSPTQPGTIVNDRTTELRAGEAPTSEVPMAEFLSKSDLAATREAPGVVRKEREAKIEAGSMLGQYRVLNRLGAGGMGEVFKAVHVTMEREVALKVLAPHLVREERARKRFKSEMQNAGKLTHPNIVISYDAVFEAERCYLVMEYVEGTDLADLVTREGVISIPRACAIIREAALGLHYAYENKLVHRDIKPANLILVKPKPGAEDGPPQVKILDFGLARLKDAAGELHDLTREGCVVGTPEFMSPEQATDSHKVDTRSDIYSLGCTLYFLIAGQPPFTGSSVMQVFSKHLHDVADPLDQVRPGVPPALAELVGRMLTKRPADRFQTPAEVAAALTPWAGVRPRSAVTPARAAPIADTEPMVSAPLRRATARPLPADPLVGEMGRMAAWFGLILALILAALTGWYLFHNNEPRGDGPTKVGKDAAPKIYD